MTEHELRASAAASAYRIGGRDALSEMGYKAPDPFVACRWSDEAMTAAWLAGWQVIASSGTDDYQGWGRLLLQPNTMWATLAWSYGSCSGCDSYEDQPLDEVLKQMTDLIDIHPSEQKARLVFDEGGW